MSQVKSARSSKPLPMDSDYNEYIHNGHMTLSHLQQGPISAPAAPPAADDYFALTPHVPHDDGSQDYTLSHHHEHADAGPSSAQAQFRVNQWTPPSSSTSKNLGHLGSRQRTFSDKKARHKSRLSNSINYDVDSSRAVSDSPPVLSNSSDASNRDELVKSKKRNPGFHIALDSLQPSNVLLRVKDQNFHAGSAGSDSRVDLTYQQMKISDPDVLFHKNGVEWDSGQENITPLMNPPNTTDVGYFGSFGIQLADQDASFSLSDSGMPSGYLSLPKDVERASTTRSDDNSTEFDEFAHFSLDGFVPVPDTFEDYNHNVPANYEANYVDHSYGHNVAHQVHLDNGQHQFDHHDFPQEHYHHHPHQQHAHQHPHQHPHQQPKQQAHPHSQNQHQHIHGHDFHVDHNHQGGLHGNHGFNHVLSGNNEDEYMPAGKAPVSQAQSLFPGRPILERSQSASSAMTASKSEMKKKKKSSRVVICPICEKHISRDFTRHSRIHNEVGRFQCVFPRSDCSHKSGKFNRPYDYKKHLLNVHFTFEDPKTRLAPNLKEKLSVRGHCNACGQHFTGNDWLNDHVLNTDKSKRCSKLRQDNNLDEDDFQSGETGEDEPANMAAFLKEESPE